MMKQLVDPKALTSDSAFSACLKTMTDRMLTIGGLSLILQGGIQMLEKCNPVNGPGIIGEFIAGLGCGLAIICFLKVMRNRRIMNNPQ